MKEVIDRVATRKYDRRVIENIDLLFSEFFYRNRFNLDERPEVNFNIEFFRQLKIRGVRISRSLLGYQDALDLSHPVSSNFTHINT
jgi:hypothetical protein